MHAPGHSHWRKQDTVQPRPPLLERSGGRNPRQPAETSEEYKISRKFSILAKYIDLESWLFFHVKSSPSQYREIILINRNARTTVYTIGGHSISYHACFLCIWRGCDPAWKNILVIFFKINCIISLYFTYFLHLLFFEDYEQKIVILCHLCVKHSSRVKSLMTWKKSTVQWVFYNLIILCLFPAQDCSVILWVTAADFVVTIYVGLPVFYPLQVRITNLSVSLSGPI